MAIGNKGNVNAKGNLGNEGGRPPKRLQNLTPDMARTQVTDINHSAQSHPDVQQAAWGKLHELHSHIGAMAEHGSVYASIAQAHIDDAQNAHSGWTPGNAVPHVEAAKSMLHEVPSEGPMHPALADALVKAHAAADSYLKTMKPSKAHTSTTVPGTESVSMNSDYRRITDKKFAVKEAQNLRAQANRAKKGDN